MTLNLKRLALLALILSISVTAYSQAKRNGNRDRSGDECNQSGLARRAMNADRGGEDRDGAFWFSRGYALHQSGHYLEAIDAFSHSISLAYRQPAAIYNVACGFALLNDKENALFWLDRALRAGFDRTDLLKEDSDLDSIRCDPRFGQMLERAEAAGCQRRSFRQKVREDRGNNMHEATNRVTRFVIITRSR
jgi:tetratricopeptide (TPR) repeat protein